jgi:hypothetical protein
MNIAELLASLEASNLATTIRDSLYWFPMIESVHVIGLTLVFGTIAIIDFRLLGIASARRPFRIVAADVMKLTWGAFLVTAVTGLLMFTTNPVVYYNNFYFRTKMLLLVLAGLNMLIFELTAGRAIHQWNKNESAPRAGKAAAVLSLVLWTSVIFVGRWIGFTTSRAAPGVESTDEINLDDLFAPAPEEGAPASPDDAVAPPVDDPVPGK